jgi:hypothetical protein
MIRSAHVIRRRWQCRFGRHQFEDCLRVDHATGSWTVAYTRCFACGKEATP